ncbi:MAG: hypothetical protein MUC49_14815 [Raineya sp.]|jgi:hypothetical protein|nr:hypothetical protein [Raineya sp.]
MRNTEKGDMKIEVITHSQIMEIFKVSRATAYNWLKLVKDEFNRRRSGIVTIKEFGTVHGYSEEFLITAIKNVEESKNVPA